MNKSERNKEFTRDKMQKALDEYINKKLRFKRKYNDDN